MYSDCEETKIKSNDKTNPNKKIRFAIVDCYNIAIFHNNAVIRERKSVEKCWLYWIAP